VYSRILGAESISKLGPKVFEKRVWVWRPLDALMPWPGLSLIAVARKQDRSG